MSRDQERARADRLARLAGLGPVLAGMVRRVQDGESWRAWAGQVEHAGHCAHPVRITGRADAVDPATGEAVASFSTDGGPDGVLLVACGDRRAAVCPSCADRYRADTWHVIAAGLRGREPSPGMAGAGGRVPGSVAGHPVVLATFTAPGFGAVHRASDGGPCRSLPVRAGRMVCSHGTPVACGKRHDGDDPQVGKPLCPDCYDYAGHVLWHGAVPDLWRRTVIYTGRALARLASERLGRRVTVRAVRDLLRVSYVKVAEYQRRGAVHLHVIARLDGVDPGDRDRLVAPPGWADVALLEAALRDAAKRAAVPLPEVGSRLRTARWGSQLDITAVNDPARTAAYLSKYATKTAGDVLAGLPARRFRPGALARLSLKTSAHVLRLAGMCFRLAEHPDCGRFRFDAYPHTLGFRGHFASKSRRYSLTLRTLRAARRAWRMARAAAGDPWAAAAEGSTVIVRDWRYLGSGWAGAGDAQLAATLAKEHVAARAHADIATVARWWDPG